MCECGREGHHGGRFEHHHHGGGHPGHCTCGEPFHFGPFKRHFWTKEEEIAHLEHYLENLRAEAKAVEEQIAKLKEAAQ